MELNRSDLDVMIEAVEAWENKDMAGEIMGDMMTAMLCKDEASHGEMMAKHEAVRRKRDDEKKCRKERSIILRAKLIALRDTLDSERLFAEAAEAH